MTPEAPGKELLYFNGINGDEGTYQIPPMSSQELAALIQGEEKPANLDELISWRERRKVKKAALGVQEGVDPNRIDQAGWGVIFPHDIDPQIIEALDPLLKLREKQAGQRFRVYKGENDHHPITSKTKFLQDHLAGPGPVNPDKIPYYLLMVGSPDQITFSFQVQMDVQYAVGRIYFETVEEYANYARSVVTAETKNIRLDKRMALFGTCHPDDPSTSLSMEKLIQPLNKNLTAANSDWEISAYLTEQAKQTQLDQLLGGSRDQTPALFFSATHGLGFNCGSARQIKHQGALLCQDWPGPEQWKQRLPESFYFAGDNLSADRNLLGMIAFFFACYGLGTPQMDQFSQHYFTERQLIAPNSFLAQLPMKMLGLPRGALAVVGHIERAWGYSFQWAAQGSQSETFQSALQSMMAGKTVGMALEFFNERYAELSTELSSRQDQIDDNISVSPNELATIWTANNDARGYAIFGDPAVRLPISISTPPQEETMDLKPLELDGPVPSPTNGDNAPKVPIQTVEEEDDIPAGVSFSPPPVSFEMLERFPELKDAWIKNMKDGYRSTDMVFNRILNAFLISHYSTLVMYWMIFLIGLGVFIAGLLVNNIYAVVSGAVGIAAFLAFFITRSVQSVEQNLLYITWLGVIYNSYWVHQLWSVDPEKSQRDLNQATADAIQQIKELIHRYEVSYKKRPVIVEKKD